MSASFNGRFFQVLSKHTLNLHKFAWQFCNVDLFDPNPFLPLLFDHLIWRWKQILKGFGNYCMVCCIPEYSRMVFHFSIVIEMRSSEFQLDLFQYFTLNPFLLAVRWLNILSKFCSVSTASFWKYVRPFFNIKRE